MTDIYRFFIILLILSYLPGVHQDIYGENWPGWRGPRMDGTSLDTDVPVQWDSTNIKWKTAIPGEGFSSPVIWEDRIFLTTAFPERQERVLLCLDRDTGNILWKRIVLQAPLEQIHPDNGYASSTPITDGSRVFVAFQDSDENLIAAYDFLGSKLWEIRPGVFQHEHGYCSSLSLYENLVILNSGSRGDIAFVAAFDSENGQEVWRIPHTKGDGSYSVPYIRDMLGSMQMIICGDGSISGHNPETAEKYWEVDSREDEFTTTPVYHEKVELILTCTSYDRRYIRAIHPGNNTGNTQPEIKWGSIKGGFYVACPLAIGDYFITIQHGGYMYCFEAATGGIIWRQKTGRQYSSPVSARGLIYSVNDEGILTVIKPGPEFNSLFRYDFGEQVMASPAISEGRLYIRGVRHLYCIGD